MKERSPERTRCNWSCNCISLLWSYPCCCLKGGFFLLLPEWLRIWHSLCHLQYQIPCLPGSESCGAAAPATEPALSPAMWHPPSLGQSPCRCSSLVSKPKITISVPGERLHHSCTVVPAPADHLPPQDLTRQHAGTLQASRISVCATHLAVLPYTSY